MCHSERMSWFTLLLGTLLNSVIITLLSIYTPSEWSLGVAVVIGWQYALLMQLVDAILWRKFNQGATSSVQSHIGCFLNLTQPVIFPVMAGATTLPDESWRVWVAFSLLGIWLVWCGINSFRISTFFNVEQQTCYNKQTLHYQWWNSNEVGQAFSWAYFATVVGQLLLLPWWWAGLSLGQIIGSFYATRKAYNCTWPSLWCWSIFIQGALGGTFAFIDNEISRIFYILGITTVSAMGVVFYKKGQYLSLSEFS